MPSAADVFQAQNIPAKTPFGEYAYGASLVPDEDEMKRIPVHYGRLSDPDGHSVEVVEGDKVNPVEKFILNVLDLNESVEFYSQILGMTLLRKRANINSIPKEASMCAYVVSKPAMPCPSLADSVPTPSSISSSPSPPSPSGLRHRER